LWNEWDRREMRTQFWWKNLKERDHLRDVGVDWKVIFKLALRKKHGMAWTGFICFKREKNVGLSGLTGWLDSN
jgi:hypothetical protein